MNALLAFSASHLAWQTKNNDTEHLAYHHRGIAMKGLHEALNSFSEQISEAVLAASILLAWQATEWQGWVSLQQGISTVMGAMRQWVHQSELAKFLESQRVLARTKTPSTPSLTGLPPQQPAAEDLQKLDQMLTALHNLRLRISSFGDLVEHVDEVLEYVEQLQQDYPLHGPHRSYERLLQLRAVVFWVPTIILRPEEMDLGALAIMAHFFALALVLEPLFPECGGMYLGNMSLDPLEKVCHTMQARSAAMPHDASLQTALSMLDFPVQVAHAYRASHRTVVASPAMSYPYMPRPIALPSGYSSASFSNPSDLSRHTSYSSPAVQSPNIMQSPYAMSNFQSPIGGRHDSSSSRAQSDHRMSLGATLQHTTSQQNATEIPTSNADYFANAQSFASMAGYGSMSDYTHRFVVPPPPTSQLWT